MKYYNYNKKLNEEIHIIIQNKGYGKCYFEKRKIEEYKKKLINRIKTEVSYYFIINHQYDKEIASKVLNIVEKEIWDYETNI